MNPSRNLLHPTFDCYRLKQQDHRLRKIQLPNPIDINIKQNYNSLNLNELKSKSAWNHLLIGHHQILCIEPATLRILAFTLHTDLNQTTSLLLQLPDHRHQLLCYQLEHPIEFDYPSGLALDHPNLTLSHHSRLHQEHPALWLFLDGGRRLFLADLNLTSPQLLAETYIDQSKFIHGFYKIQSVQPQEQPNTFWVILRAKSTESHPPACKIPKTNSPSSSSSKRTKKNKLIYTIYLIQLSIVPNPCFGSDSSLAYSLDIQPHLQLNGSHDLLSVHYEKSARRWCLRSASSFATSTSIPSIQETTAQSIPPEIVKPNSNSDHPISNSPYNWSQTLSSITIIFHIPCLVTSKFIKIQFQSDSIHFKLIQPDLPSADRKILDNYLQDLVNYFKPGTTLDEVNSSFENDQFDLKIKLWDHVKIEDCTWFIESSTSSQKTTCLTIELEKSNQLRWPQTFKSDDRVNETMDPIELLSITENLQKYTSNLDQSEDQGSDFKRQKRGLGLLDDESSTTTSRLPNPSPAYLRSSQQEMMRDEEIIDLDHQLMITGIVMTWLIEPKPDPNKNQSSDWIIKVAQDGIPVELISNPLPLLVPPKNEDGDHGQKGSKEEDENNLSDSIMIKSDTDGLVFKPPKSSNKQEDKNEFNWVHELTFPGLSFILGSKTEICFSFFTNRLALIFESSCSSLVYNNNNNLNSHPYQHDQFKIGNVYAYYLPEKNQVNSNQKIIQLTSEFNFSSSEISKKEKDETQDDINEAQKEREEIKNSFKNDDRIIGVCGIISNNDNLTSPTTSIVCLSKFNLFIFDL